MEKYFGVGQSYEVWAPIDATNASQLLLKILAEQGGQEASLEMDSCSDLLIEQSLATLEEYQKTGRGISHAAMKQWASELGN